MIIKFTVKSIQIKRISIEFISYEKKELKNKQRNRKKLDEEKHKIYVIIQWILLTDVDVFLTFLPSPMGEKFERIRIKSSDSR